MSVALAVIGGTERTEPNLLDGSQKNVPTAKTDIGNDFVYFIRNGRMIKIGYSKNPVARSRALRGQLIGYIKGTREKEREIHKQFYYVRHANGSEWFYSCEELEGFISKQEFVDMKEHGLKGLKQIAIREHSHDRLKKMAEMTGVTLTYLIDRMSVLVDACPECRTIKQAGRACPCKAGDRL